MKHVVKGSDVGHLLWANKLQDSARVAAGNYYFEGDTIYSYGSHFPIARHYTAMIKGRESENLVLFTNRTYSNTTAQHIIAVRRAVSHLKKVYCWSLPLNKGDIRAHVDNVSHWFGIIQENINKIQKAKKPEMYASAIAQVKTEMSEYLHYFPIVLTKDQKKLLKLSDASEFKEFAKKSDEIKQADYKKALKIAKPILDGKNEVWRNYGDVPQYLKELKLTDQQKKFVIQINDSNIDSNKVMLRTNGSELETSKSISLPVAVARRSYEFYLRIVAAGGCSGNCKHEILGYTVVSADAGSLVVGCHNISRSEIDYIAKKLNW